jgi:microcin C transport system permease protein
MGAYILRRVLLMIPTLFGIMAISFVLIQFAPGGPVEQVIAASPAGRRFRRPALRRRGGRRQQQNIEMQGGEGVEISRRAGPRPGIHRQAGKAVRLRQAAARTLRQDDVGLCALRFRRELFRDIKVIDLIIEKMPVSISLGLWITLLSYLISIPLGIRKAVEGRLAFRRLDQRRGHRRLRHPRLPVRHPADDPVRRRQSFSASGRLRLLPAARPDLGELDQLSLAARSSTISGTCRCR